MTDEWIESNIGVFSKALEDWDYIKNILTEREHPKTQQKISELQFKNDKDILTSVKGAHAKVRGISTILKDIQSLSATRMAMIMDENKILVTNNVHLIIKRTSEFKEQVEHFVESTKIFYVKSEEGTLRIIYKDGNRTEYEIDIKHSISQILLQADEIINKCVENMILIKQKSILSGLKNLDEEIGSIIEGVHSSTTAKIDEVISNTTAKIDEANINANAKIDEVISNATTKTDEVISNATAKTDEVISNATAKTDEVISNATAKTDEVISNATARADEAISATTAKTDKAISNATAKIDEANTNATAKIDEANTNATAKIDEANTNATAKIDEANTNATAKIDEANTNATAKINEVNATANTKIDEMTTKIDELNKDTKTKIDELNLQADKVKEESTEILDDMQVKKVSSEGILKEMQKILGGGIVLEITHTIEEKKKESEKDLEKAKKFHLKTLLAFLAYSLILLLIPNSWIGWPETQPVWEYVIRRIPVIIPGLLFVVFSSNQYNSAFRRSEYYASKYIIASSIKGFQDQVEGDQYKDAIASTIFSELLLDPGEFMSMIEKKKKRKNATLIEKLISKLTGREYSPEGFDVLEDDNLLNDVSSKVKEAVTENHEKSAEKPSGKENKKKG